MYFFTKFPKTEYQIKPGQPKKIVTNILTAFYLRKIKTMLRMIYHKYTVKDEDSLESVSYKFYKKTLHYWSILLANNIIDPYSEWAMPYEVLEHFTAKKYAQGIKLQKKDGSFYTLPGSIGTWRSASFLEC